MATYVMSVAVNDDDNTLNHLYHSQRQAVDQLKRIGTLLVWVIVILALLVLQGCLFVGTVVLVEA